MMTLSSFPQKGARAAVSASKWCCRPQIRYELSQKPLTMSEPDVDREASAPHRRLSTRLIRAREGEEAQGEVVGVIMLRNENNPDSEAAAREEEERVNNQDPDNQDSAIAAREEEEPSARRIAAFRRFRDRPFWEREFHRRMASGRGRPWLDEEMARIERARMMRMDRPLFGPNFIWENIDDEEEFDLMEELMMWRPHEEFRRNQRERTPRDGQRIFSSTPYPPLHIKEYLDFNAAVGMSFENVTKGVELASPGADFDPTSLFLKRVTACIGWAVHGLVFEFVNGDRMGCILVDFGDRSMDLSDTSIERRSGVGWTDIEYGDYIVGIHGDKLADPNKQWFCHTLVLDFSSGRIIRYESKHEPWRGAPFSYSVPQPCLIYRVAFKYDQKEDALGLKTSIHLAVSRANVYHLPPKYKQHVLEILVMARRIDSERETSGKKAMGDDVWWRILGFLNGWHLLPSGATDGDAKPMAVG